MRRSLVSAFARACLAGCLLSSAGPAHAQLPAAKNPEARVHIERGLSLYQTKDYRGAASAIAAAYALEPMPELLYMWAQSLRLAGDCAGAIPLYHRFLASDPAAQEAERARKNIQRCEPGAAPLPESAPAPPSPYLGASSGLVLARPLPAPTLVARPPAPAVVVRPGPMLRAGATQDEEAATGDEPSWRRDGWGHAFVAAGALSLGGGFVAHLSARQRRDDALNAMTYAEVASGASSASFRQKLAVGGFALGTTLVLAGVVRYLVTEASGR